MSSVTPSTNGDLKKKVKEKIWPTNSGTKAGFVSPLYGEVPKILKGDGNHSFTRKEFAQKIYIVSFSFEPQTSLNA
jgi:hypothetical protein